MTPAETAQLVRLVRQACPAQKFEDATPVLWHKMLQDLRYGDCQDAVIELGKRIVFMAPAEIRAEVKRIRADRVSRAVIDVAEADADPDDAGLYIAAKRAQTRRIANGEPEPARPALTARPVAALLGETAAKLPHVPGSSTVKQIIEQARAAIHGEAAAAKKQGTCEACGGTGWITASQPYQRCAHNQRKRAS